MRLLHVRVLWCKRAKIIIRCQSVLLTFIIVEPFTWHSVVSRFNCPPSPLPESLVYGLQKKNYKKFKKHKKKTKDGSIIFYRSSPVALTRERCTSITGDVVSQWCVPSLGSLSCAVNLSLVWVFTLLPFRPIGHSGKAEMAPRSSWRRFRENERDGGICLKDAPLRLVVVSQANRGY